MNNKSFKISDLITTHSPDFQALTENWPEDATSPSLVCNTPLNYSFLELARPPTKPLSSSIPHIWPSFAGGGGGQSEKFAPPPEDS